MLNIYLLTHQRERFKKTNTGKLVADVLQENATVIIWDRVNPNQILLNAINEGKSALLYPSSGNQVSASSTNNFENYIIIDGTWQEARKIYNQSPYLKTIPTVELSRDKPSAYHLRRNQKNGGLCTAECAIELLQTEGFAEQANDLQTAFLKHIS